MPLTVDQIKDMNAKLDKAYKDAKKLKGNLKGNSSTDRARDIADLALLVKKMNIMLNLAKENSAKLTLPGGPTKFNNTLAEMVAMVPSPSTQASTQVVTASVVEPTPVVTAPVVEQQGNVSLSPSSVIVEDVEEEEVVLNAEASPLLITNFPHNVAPVVEQQGNGNIVPVVEHQQEAQVQAVKTSKKAKKDQVKEEAQVQVKNSLTSEQVSTLNKSLQHDFAKAKEFKNTLLGDSRLSAAEKNEKAYQLDAFVTAMEATLAKLKDNGSKVSYPGGNRKFTEILAGMKAVIANQLNSVFTSTVVASTPVAEPTPVVEKKEEVVTASVVEQQGNGNIVPVVEHQQEAQVQAVKTSKKAKKAQVKVEEQVEVKNSLTSEQVSTLNKSLQNDFAKAKEFKNILLGDSRLSAAEKNDKAHQLQVFVTAMEATLAKLKDNGSKVSYPGGKNKFDKTLAEMKVAIANQLNSGFTVTASTQVAVSTVIAPAPTVVEQQQDEVVVPPSSNIIVEDVESDDEEVQDISADQPAANNVRHNVSFASLTDDSSDDEYDDEEEDEDVVAISGMGHSLFSPLKLSSSSPSSFFARRQGNTPKETPIVAALNKEIARLDKASATTGITGLLWSSSMYKAKMLAANKAMNSLEGGLTDESITEAMSNHDSDLYKALNTHTSIIFAFSLDCCGLSFSWQTRSVLNLEKAIKNNGSSLKHEPLILDTEFDAKSYEL